MVTLTTITHLCIVTKRLLVFDQPNERYPLNFFLAQSPLLIGDGDLFCLSSSLVLSLHIQDTIFFYICHIYFIKIEFTWWLKANEQQAAPLALFGLQS